MYIYINQLHSDLTRIRTSSIQACVNEIHVNDWKKRELKLLPDIVAAHNTNSPADTLSYLIFMRFQAVHRTCWWTLRWWSCQQMDAGKVFKYSVSNWLRLKSSACSRRGYWLSRKLKHLNVEEDRCCWLRGLETTARTTRGRKVDVRPSLDAHLIDGRA